MPSSEADCQATTATRICLSGSLQYNPLYWSAGVCKAGNRRWLLHIKRSQVITAQMALRLAAAAARHSSWLHQCAARTAQALYSNSSGPRLAPVQQEAAAKQDETREPSRPTQRQPPPARLPAAAAGLSSSAVVVRRQPESLVHRALSTALNAIHRLMSAELHASKWFACTAGCP